MEEKVEERKMKPDNGRKSNLKVKDRVSFPVLQSAG